MTDTPAFRRVVLIASIISATFACSLVLFIRLLPDSKTEAQEGLRATARREHYLIVVVSFVVVAVGFAVVMILAPFAPALACNRFFGGAGCHSR